MKIAGRDFSNEILFAASRSSGPGGQNVNKVNTRIELRFNINSSILLNDSEKDILLRKLKNKVNQDGDLIITSQSERSQLKNKEIAIKKFLQTLEKALTPVKRRIPGKPTLSSTLKKQENKKKLSEKKVLRKKIY